MASVEEGWAVDAAPALGMDIPAEVGGTRAVCTACSSSIEGILSLSVQWVKVEQTEEE
jgi:hypothetical protein